MYTIVFYSITSLILLHCFKVQSETIISQSESENKYSLDKINRESDTNEYIEDGFPKVLRLFPENEQEYKLTELAESGANNNSPAPNKCCKTKTEDPLEDKPFFCQQHRCNTGVKHPFNFTEDHRSNTRRKDDNKCFQFNENGK
ncbi:uncharacterized protein LOC111044259 [Nilaparvata lugens]|uniref:uncharacterized protein LOC111044259 n=1 Tax=Nilaparvata lugens TaxID=108931 RepID=UPI00193DD84F|nr:uncharacterized protein LOC111044259 [Nilaparvata lugens]